MRETSGPNEVPVSQVPGPSSNSEVNGPSSPIQLPGPSRTSQAPGPSYATQLPGPSTVASQVPGHSRTYGVTVPSDPGTPEILFSVPNVSLIWYSVMKNCVHMLICVMHSLYTQYHRREACTSSVDGMWKFNDGYMKPCAALGVGQRTFG